MDFASCVTNQHQHQQQTFSKPPIYCTSQQFPPHHNQNLSATTTTSTNSKTTSARPSPKHNLVNNNQSLNNSTLLSQQSLVQRKLCTFVYIYAILIIALYVTYAVYYFYQHNQAKSQVSVGAEKLESTSTNEQSANAIATATATASELEQRLESKIHLLERYIEVIALDLQETKGRLREREKCACTINCSFNGTRYADRSTWQSQCDICTCQSGQISCVPQKCPQTNCDDAIQLPGQCCPTCMKRCRHNGQKLKHGQRLQSQRKECQCLDGRIKCEPIQSKQRQQKVNGLNSAIRPSASQKSETDPAKVADEANELAAARGKSQMTDNASGSVASGSPVANEDARQKRAADADADADRFRRQPTASYQQEQQEQLRRLPEG